MKIARGLPALVIAFMLTATAHAQDIHFTMFDMAPLTLNPAYTGAYEGTFRVGGIYRDQWNNISSVNGFRTPSAYVDAPLVPINRNNSWFGIGGNFINDKRGSALLNTTGGGLSLAYHFPLGKARRIYLGVGASAGYVNERIDKEKVILADQYNQNNLNQPPGTTTDLANLQPVSYIDFGAGLILNARISRSVGLDMGFSTRHLTEPDEAFLTAASVPEELRKRPRQYIGHARVDIDLSSRLSLYPMAFYSLQRKASFLNTQALMGYHFNPERDVTLLFGAGYRLGESLIARLGFNFKGFRIGAAYDINVGSLSNYTDAHAFELAASYTARIYPRKVLPPRIFCPRF
jgi:type IX secretion system PorP/SprF family membrane protein